MKDGANDQVALRFLKLSSISVSPIYWRAGFACPGVAGEHFVGEREALGGDDQGNDHLRAVGAFLAAVAEAFLAQPGIGWRVAFEIRAGQVVEQDFEPCPEEVVPAGPQMLEELASVRQQFVVAVVEGVLGHDVRIHAEEVAHGALAIPLAVQIPFGGGLDEPRADEQLQDLVPRRALATGRQLGSEEGVELEQVPYLQGEPARAPLSGAAEFQARKVDLHGLHLAGIVGELFGRLAIGGEKGDLLEPATPLECGDGFAPRPFWLSLISPR